MRVGFAGYMMMTWPPHRSVTLPLSVVNFHCVQGKVDNSAFKFKASLASGKENSDDLKSKASLEPVADFVVRTNDYAPGASTMAYTPWPSFHHRNSRRNHFLRSG